MELAWHFASNTGSYMHIITRNAAPCFFFVGVRVMIFVPKASIHPLPCEWVESHVSRTMEAAVLRAECELFLQGAEPSWWT